MKKLIKFSIAGLFLFLIGFAFQNCHSNKSTINRIENQNIASKLNGVWFLSTIEGSRAKDVFKGPIPSLSFDMATRSISGNGGCNTYNGSFTLVGNIYTPTPLATTMMACAHQNQEGKLLTLLGERSTLILNNKTLQFVQNGRVVLEFTPKAR